MTAARTVDGPGFRIQYQPGPGHLRAYVFDGVDSIDVSIAMWRMLGAECRARQVDRLLVVEDLAATVDTGELGRLTQAMEEAGFVGMRTAFVELRDDLPGNEFGEILCRERGMAIRVFSDETEARRWLVYGD
ncbi:MAG: hypothetical protein J0L59_03430 [Xanthomonadales bacterium]|nr:hypothetical protein [Xanthomonadales bacterium]